MKHYWVAANPLGETGKFSAKGFSVFSLTQDYVFLEVTPENHQKVAWGERAGLIFLKSGGHLAKITEEQFQCMVRSPESPLSPGMAVKVTDGPYRNLVGTILNLNAGGQVHVLIVGQTRVYHAMLPATYLVKDVSTVSVKFLRD